MTPAAGQVVTVLRSRLVDGDTGYADDAAGTAELARSTSGYVEHEAVTPQDGERVTVVTFADRASHAAWRDHPEHRARAHQPEDRGCSTQIGTTSYASAWSRA